MGLQHRRRPRIWQRLPCRQFCTQSSLRRTSHHTPQSTELLRSITEEQTVPGGRVRTGHAHAAENSRSQLQARLAAMSTVSWQLSQEAKTRAIPVRVAGASVLALSWEAGDDSAPPAPVHKHRAAPVTLATYCFRLQCQQCSTALFSPCSTAASGKQLLGACSTVPVQKGTVCGTVCRREGAGRGREDLKPFPLG